MKTNIFLIFVFILLEKSSIQQNITTSYEITNNLSKKKLFQKYTIKLNKSINDFENVKINYKEEEDFFILNNQTYIIFPSNNKELSNNAELLAKVVKNLTGLEILVAPNVIRKTSNKNKNTFIQIVLDKSINKEFHININKRKIILSSKSNEGIYKSVILFKKILESQFNDKNSIYENIEFPCVDIISNEQIIKFEYLSLVLTSIIIIFISALIFQLTK
jgi:hypothetical protein